MPTSPILAWSVYRITNPEGRIYVGRTRDLKARIYNHLGINRQTNRLLKESVLKFGADSHKVDVLDAFRSDEEYADGKEMFWIRSLMANVGKWPEGMGFNLTDGSRKNLGWVQPKETIEKRRKTMTGRKMPEGQRVDMIKRMTGVKLPRQRAINIGKGHQRPMVIYDSDGNFIKECESSRHAYHFLYGKWGTCGHINEVAKGKRESYKGYIFKYKKDV